MPHTSILSLHPLRTLRFRTNGSVRVGELMARAGLSLLPTSDADLWTTCPKCERTQSLGEAQFGPGRRRGDLGMYRCADGCGTVLVSIAFPGRKAPADLSELELDDVELTVRGVGGLCFRSNAHGSSAAGGHDVDALAS